MILSAQEAVLPKLSAAINKEQNNKQDPSKIVEQKESGSSSESEKNLEVLLNKQVILELSGKQSKDIRNFINLLKFYGHNILLEK